MNIGKKIKELRILESLTQEDLAERTELTKGYISQLENDLAEPSVSTLENIVEALGVSMSDFFKDDLSNKIVFKDSDYPIKEYDEYSIEYLVPNSSKNIMEPIRLILHPNMKTDIDYPHEGEEFGYVLKGCVTLIIDDKKYKINKGETFYFTPSKNHYLENKTNSDCELIWVSSPSNF